MLLHPYPITVKNIKLKKKITYLNKKIYPIKYDNEPIVIQTPILFLPWGISKYNTLDISLSSDDKKIKNFEKLINMIENHFNSLYFFKKYIFRTSIKKSHIFPDILKASVDINNIIVFDEKKSVINIKNINIKSFAKFIIQPAFIWINDGQFGIKWIINQIKVYTNLIYKPCEYKFIDSDTEEESNLNDNTNDNNPLYSKYFKMLKMGIPKIAVINKIKLNGLDPSILDSSDKKIKSKINNKNFLLDIKNKLKKNEPIERKKYTSSNKFTIKPEDLLRVIQKIKSNKCVTNK